MSAIEDAPARANEETPAAEGWVDQQFKLTSRHRTQVWIAIAVLLAVVGSVCALWAADAEAGIVRQHEQTSFAATAADISSRLQLALQREQDLIVTAAGFFGRIPTADNTSLALWLSSTQALARYPELMAIGEVVPVAAAQLPAFTQTLVADPPGGVPIKGPLAIIPPGPRSQYCLARVGQGRDADLTTPAGYDFCSGPFATAMQAGRDSGSGTYFSFGSGTTRALAVMTPAYRAGAPTASVADRRAAFLGWIGTVVDPSIVLGQTLANYPHTAVTLTFRDSSSTTSFEQGPIAPGARSRTTDLGAGWTARTYTVLAPTGITDSRSSLALLCTGVSLSLALAALVLVLATTRARATNLVRQRTQQLRHQALHDALTGLPNRILIVDRIQQMLARNRRNGTFAAALYLDLDGFKDINDSLGHAIGDRLLRAVAGRLRESLRDVDTIGRMGGDEFVILTDAATEPSGPQVVAVRVLELLRHPLDIEGVLTPITITASIGLAIGHDQTPGELLREADTALYQAKAAGKNTFETFRPQMSRDVRQRFELEAELRVALDRGQFRLVYQPIYRLDDLSLCGVEALMRWNHPTRGEVGPDQFIPVLESNTHILEVGRWVLTTACTEAARWHRHGHRIGVSVNVSGRQLDRDSIVDDVRHALTSTGLEPHALTIEITETAAMTNIEATAHRLHQLKALGIHIAIDDFGTGYSSLAYLQRLPADSLKIDQQFVGSINASAESDTLMHTLIQLGQTLGMSTLAEGVETQAQLDYLRAEGVDQMQGYLLSQPLTADALEQVLGGPLSIELPV